MFVRKETLRPADEVRWGRIVDPGTHWPGYLGAHYRLGGVLSVGLTYTAFDSGGLT